jgi:hypothetical protein
MRVCQFRHFGKWNAFESDCGSRLSKNARLLFYRAIRRSSNLRRTRFPVVAHASLAFIEIFAFSTLDTGQPFSAASAYF